MPNIGPDRWSGGIPTAAFAPTPALDLLRDAAELVGGKATRLVAEIERDHPGVRTPAQLVRAADASQRDLAELVRAAGFRDLDDLRRHAVRDALPPSRRVRRTPPPAPDPASGREQDSVTGALSSVRASGELALAATAILGSRRRWVFGDLRSRGFAQLFAAELTTALGQVVLVDPTSAGVLSAVGDAQRRDSLTVFTFRRYSRLSVRLTQQFADRGATVVAVTDDDTGPVADRATHLLRVVTPDGVHSPTAAVAVGHALATLTASGAKGAARRAAQERSVADELQWYEDGTG